jgi:hypothetical protein
LEAELKLLEFHSLCQRLESKLLLAVSRSHAKQKKDKGLDKASAEAADMGAPAATASVQRVLGPANLPQEITCFVPVCSVEDYPHKCPKLAQARTRQKVKAKVNTVRHTAKFGPLYLTFEST